MSCSPPAPATATSPANYVFVPANLDPFSGLHSPAARAYFAHRTTPAPRINPEPLAYPFLNNGYWGVSAEINWTIDAGTLTVIPAFASPSCEASVPLPQSPWVIAGGVMHTVVFKLALFAALALHVAGAVKHAAVDRDSAMFRRMWGR